MATIEKVHILKAESEEDLEKLYNAWAKERLKTVGLEIIDRKFSQSGAVLQIAVFYREVIL
jgi:hypothetical protein